MMIDPSSLPYRPCVGVVLINAKGLIWTGQRIDSPTPNGAWQMPQGGIDDGEKPRDAALRELWEETGVTEDLVEYVAKTDGWLTYDLPPDLVGKVWKGKFRGQKQKWFLFKFLGDDSRIDIAREHPEFSAWKWCDPKEMVRSIVPFKRDVYEQVVTEFQDYLS